MDPCESSFWLSQKKRIASVAKGKVVAVLWDDNRSSSSLQVDLERGRIGTMLSDNIQVNG